MGPKSRVSKTDLRGGKSRVIEITRTAGCMLEKRKTVQPMTEPEEKKRG